MRKMFTVIFYAAENMCRDPRVYLYLLTLIWLASAVFCSRVWFCCDNVKLCSGASDSGNGMVHSPNPQRIHTILTPAEVAEGYSTKWNEIEITGRYLIRTCSAFLTFTNVNKISGAPPPLNPLLPPSYVQETLARVFSVTKALRYTCRVNYDLTVYVLLRHAVSFSQN